MPFVTEFRTNMVLKSLIGEIPENIREWEPYKKSIYFLNRLDKTNLIYFKKFCENPIENIDKIYNPIEVIDRKKYVYEGAKPSYHKFEDCQFLHSNFVNYPIPDEIREKGDEAVEEFRNWFKESEEHFRKFPDQYKLRMFQKYKIEVSINDLKVDYQNSGNVYKENLTLKDIETRIDSLLNNAAKYYKEDVKRQEVIRRFQTATFLAFKEDIIENNTTEYSDEELKEILIEYHNLFIEPTLYYLKEFFKTFYNADIEINEKIFEELNFKKCGHCFSDKFEKENNYLSEKKEKLVKRFGEFEFPIEPTIFHFKNSENKNSRIAFIYCRVFRQIDNQFQEDEFGKYKLFKVEFINHKNRFIYMDSKIYENEISGINLFRKYITKIEQNKETKKAELTTYAHEI